MEKRQEKFKILDSRGVKITSLVFLFVVSILSTVLTYIYHQYLSEQYLIFNIVADTLGMWILTVMFLAFFMDKRNKGARSSLLLFLFFLDFCGMASDFYFWFFNGYPRWRILTLCFKVLSYIAIAVMICTFWRYCLEQLNIRFRKVSIFINVLTGIAVLLSAANLFFPLIFYIDEGGSFIRAEFYPAIHILSVLALTIICICILMDRKSNWGEKCMLLTYPVMVFTASVLSAVFPRVTSVFVLVMISLLLFYSILSVNRASELAEKDAQLANQKMDAMVSQIQPHFVFNSLNTIEYLCKKNPAMAEKAVSDFAQYLRTNIDFLGKQELIPFYKEMNHVKTYIELEQLRYADRFDVTYENDNASFPIPYLTVQPIVENSIKHGMLPRGQKMHIMIKCTEVKGGHTLTIQDNGIGFDTSKPLDTSRQHIGVENVAGRIRSMCNGTMEVESTPGVGTTTHIFIPTMEVQNAFPRG